jgi:hypothetical protein
MILNKKKKEIKDKCVLCGNDSPHNINEHIDNRTCYIEGAGQLCPSCYESTYSKIKKIRYPGL